MTLKNVLEDICAKEYALPENVPAHRFKRRHCRAVNAVLYPDGLPKTERKMKLRRRVLAAAVIVGLAMVTGAAASFYRYNGFEFHKSRIKGVGKYYVMLVEDRENAPKTIEKIIYDDNVPEDFTFRGTFTADGVDKDKFIENQYVSYERINKFGGNGAYVNIWQCTKSFFVDPITDNDMVAPVEVKGCNGFAITSEEAMNVVVWNSGDYIHIINGTLSVEELLDIAENMIEK